MADRAKKISELPALTAATGDDLMVVVDAPSGNAVTKSITVASLLGANSANIHASHIRENTPAAANSFGVKGEITFSSGYIYVCVANNTWKRAALN
jgi:hypothetical protein